MPHTLQIDRAIDVLLSLPPACAGFHALSPPARSSFVASDPPGRQLGSGGGTLYLLLEAWRASGRPDSFWEWLGTTRKLIVHGGGRSRRLPAYAALGKPLIPMPVMRRTFGERLDQCLIDFQLAAYESLLADSPDSYRVMVTSGDVLLRFDELAAEYPVSDVLGFGMRVEPDVAQDFGVFFSDPGEGGALAFFLQKPDASEIVLRAARHDFLVDTGIWMLSEQAIRALAARCGIDPELSTVPAEALIPAKYELYAEFGLALGNSPDATDPVVGALTASVLPLPRPQFYHLGTNRQLLESVSTLQDSLPRRGQGGAGGLSHPDVFILNSVFDPPARRAANTLLWVENSFVPASWQLASAHVITGVPRNEWRLSLDSGVCLDITPILGGGRCIRAYGFDDPFSGAIGDPATRWFDRPAWEWFARRGIVPEQAGIDPNSDIHDAPLFPIAEGDLDGEFVQWLIARRPEPNEEFTSLWMSARRICAFQVNLTADIGALYAQRMAMLAEALPSMQAKQSGSVFYQLDLDDTARLLQDRLATTSHVIERDGPERIGLFGDCDDATPSEPLMASKDAMLRATLARRRHQDELAARYEREAFSCLRESLVAPSALAVDPQKSVLDDQIVWARSPVRLDLGGGWTDTPPYCLQQGGRVVNIAVDLNGQPPIQVFAKVSPKPEMVIRSIDLGVGETIASYDELDTYARPGSEFALAKAALVLAGFLPRFHASGGYPTLAAQLADFGGGIELSMVAAVPAGSGLGTSSILAATLLGALSELCGLGWDDRAVVQRALALEQMLTTGGGWQDQIGGIYRGVKLAETMPGLIQEPSVRWLPEHLFHEHANSEMLLYYTGITRMAKNILQEIVRGMFLNRARVLECLDQIGHNADLAFDAVQRGSYDALARTVARSWTWNQALDSGTNPPGVQEIFETAGDGIFSGKLLGAGGGGYLLLFARDARAAANVRERLTAQPPNARARFVDFSVSPTGLQVTRS